ncbi:hypothetical protein [Spiroplasma floricola]|uniref:Uncharacterized protein n=1 Tax=Spiroplasma floricola 23-6 TaxID=1336749 RepID=A0A2K8SEN8_9MOLU|nr:hypothetical protein [Spiroplasma floricola]AUB31815.1 hypothetical protein SFLOR_v1c07670 [Spiroplasma floricola 23-6]
MKELICNNCKSNADFKRISQLNVVTLICKKCAIKELNAQLKNNDKTKCETCENVSKYMLVTQLNRVKNYCEVCLLKDYKKSI